MYCLILQILCRQLNSFFVFLMLLSQCFIQFIFQHWSCLWYIRKKEIHLKIMTVWASLMNCFFILSLWIIIKIVECVVANAHVIWWVGKTCRNRVLFGSESLTFCILLFVLFLYLIICFILNFSFYCFIFVFYYFQFFISNFINLLIPSIKTNDFLYTNQINQFQFAQSAGAVEYTDCISAEG